MLSSALQPHGSKAKSRYLFNQLSAAYERICKVCNQEGTIEDPMHFVLRCEYYAP
jgi:hypothetical protein